MAFRMSSWVWRRINLVVTWGSVPGTSSFRSNGVPDENVRGDRSKEWVNIHGRLSPGVSVRQASAAVATVTAQLARTYPATNEFRAGIAAPYDPLGTFGRSDIRRLQAVASTLTGMVLLVVSLNISGMMQ